VPEVRKITLPKWDLIEDRVLKMWHGMQMLKAIIRDSRPCDMQANRGDEVVLSKDSSQPFRTRRLDACTIGIAGPVGARHLLEVVEKLPTNPFDCFNGTPLLIGTIREDHQPNAEQRQGDKQGS
jgi:hypothetical protein